MSDLWMLAAITSTAGAVRELIALRRCRARWASIERVVARAMPGTRLVDRDRDGAVIDVTIKHVDDRSAAQAHHEPHESAS